VRPKLPVILLAGAMLTLLAFSMPQPQSTAPAKEARRAALVEITGANSKIERREFHRIMTSQDWLDLWSRHTGEDKEMLTWSGAYPQVDFTRCMVVAVFRGKAINSRGEPLTEAVLEDGALHLRTQSASYQTASDDGTPDKGDSVRPFGIWVLERSTKPIVIERDVRSLKNQAPRWKEQASFEAVK
jgi:hypothetical protein